jgi:glycosyltransferase involved in cell wall biosynthesis
MNIYLQMLSEGMGKRGHQVEIWKPEPFFYNFPIPRIFKKWMGYIDQFIVFPFQVKKKLKNKKIDLFVFTDNALGPWVPIVSKFPHVVHCHDFLAQESELGLILENHLSWTGRQYQNYIRSGYKYAKNFICVSEKTKEDLQRILKPAVFEAEVVYNGINPIFKPMDVPNIRTELTDQLGLQLKDGYLLHVGGNLWYKNRIGVLECYLEWRKRNADQILPLILVGEKLNDEMNVLIADSPFKNDIHVLQGIGDDTICKLYAGAKVFLFPSLYEGFGWPIAEAMASAVPVITTNSAPMTEVGGQAAFYLPKRPSSLKGRFSWIALGADAIEQILNLPDVDLQKKIAAGIEQVKKFNLEANLDKMERIYKHISMPENAS